MAICFLELCQRIIDEKRMDSSSFKPAANHQLANAERALNESRKLFYRIVESSWNALTAEGNMEEALPGKLSEVSKQLSKTSIEVVDGLYPYCGMIAARVDSEINRVWRNFHTASQHSLVL